MNRGTIYTLLAGIAWGLSGVSGQYLMGHGYSPFVLTTIRLVLAGVTLTAMAYVHDANNIKNLLKDRRSLLGIFVFALFGLILNQYTYLTAIQETNAGTATVLQYVCPAGILAYTCLRNRTMPSLMDVFSILLAMLGTFLIATHGHLDQLAMTPIGLFWGLLSAFTYAIYIILPVELIKRWGSLSVVGLGMLMGGILLAPFANLTTHSWRFDGMIFLSLVGIIGVGTIFAYTLFLKGTSLVGPVKSSLLASIEPVSAVFFAVFLMGDQFYWIDILGMLLILLGVLLISVKDLLTLKNKGLL